MTIPPNGAAKQLAISLSIVCEMPSGQTDLFKLIFFLVVNKHRLFQLGLYNRGNGGSASLKWFKRD